MILASGSPRRKELLKEAGVEFEVVASAAEEVHDVSMPLIELCELNARLKAEAVASEHADAVVIGSDTLVFIDETPLGKPADLEEARAMLRRLSGKKHVVCTAVCVMAQGGTKQVFHDCTQVRFKALEEADIEHYLGQVNPLDKAGAYGIQEHGELIVEGIEGRFDTVMGLPVEPLLAVLRNWRADGPGE
ncbi:MAG: Maf family protein [Akkermansiaceae bacterium]|nr:Maf family protein [Akkermansiaceae bacterium]